MKITRIVLGFIFILTAGCTEFPAEPESAISYQAAQEACMQHHTCIIYSPSWHDAFR